MNNFNSFILNKHLDRLAEKCVRENIPIVEFTKWYEEEGQYLKEGFWGDVSSNAAKGAAAGGLAAGVPTGGTGALAGAGIGAAAGGAYGAGKYLYNKLRGNAGVSSVADVRKQAMDALEKLKTLTGADSAAVLDKMLARIQRIGPAPTSATATPAPAPAPAPAPPTSAPAGTTETTLPVPPLSIKLRRKFPNFLDSTGKRYHPDVISKVDWKTIAPLYNFLNNKYQKSAEELLTYLVKNNPTASKEAQEMHDRAAAPKPWAGPY